MCVSLEAFQESNSGSWALAPDLGGARVASRAATSWTRRASPSACCVFLQRSAAATAAGWVPYTGYMRKNGPSVTDIGALGFGSLHTGGSQFLMADGAVRFISENIDAGNQAAIEVVTGASPYGIWGALGTKSASEIFSDF